MNKYLYYQFSSVAQSCPTFCDPMDCMQHVRPSITSCRSSFKLTLIESVMPPNNLVLCRPFFLLPSIFPSIRVFSNESVFHISWPKYWSFSFSISASNEYSGLISFRMNWLDLLAVQGTLKRFPQHHSSNSTYLFTYFSTYLHTQRKWTKFYFKDQKSITNYLPSEIFWVASSPT